MSAEIIEVFCFFLISARIDSATMDILSFGKGIHFLFVFKEYQPIKQVLTHNGI